LLTLLYSDGTVDPVALNPVTVQPVDRTLAPIGHLRAIVRSINGLLRGHPHDWPEASGEGHSILDFGCFDGGKLVYWYQRGWRVAGIDLNQQALQVAEEKFTWPVLADRFEQLS
jgi:2-polyprenyl-3-methyl-5-hydroxy-6-metoxy-1,4-benzoquinol methylase